MRTKSRLTSSKRARCKERAVLSFAFDKLELNAILADALRRALAAEFGHTSKESQRQSWRCIRKFAAFLKETGIADHAQLPQSVAIDFRSWLEGTKLKGSTCQSHLNVVLVILSWCERNISTVIAKNIKLAVPRFMREMPAIRDTLNENQLKLILAACYKDIECFELDLKRGAAARTGKAFLKSDTEIAVLVPELLRLGDGTLPTQRVINRSRNSYARRVNDANGLRALARLLWVTPEMLFTYYLAILVQTSANPMALLEIERNCIRRHPLRSDMERLVWMKRRAHSEQKADFPSGRERSAIGLVRRLALLNENLVPRCDDEDRSKLFICRREQRTVGIPCMQLMHHLLDEFIKRHDLPHFDFKDLRAAGANAHQKAGKSIRAAQHRLNHASAQTTARYVKRDDIAEHHEQVIRRFQGELVRLSTAAESRPKRVVVKGGDAPKGNHPSSTVFGFLCRDPLGGILPGTRAGVTCLHFSQCATCPGSLIPLDDVRTVARLWSTYITLSQRREKSILEGWWPRFDMLYEPTRFILEREIFPLIDDSVLEKAKVLANPGDIPWLE